MPKRSPREKLFEWRVIKIRSTPAALVGYFTAATADDAIKGAIVEREISDPLTQSKAQGRWLVSRAERGVISSANVAQVDFGHARWPAYRGSRRSICDGAAQGHRSGGGVLFGRRRSLAL
jgi:hypothetical protein